MDISSLDPQTVIQAIKPFIREAGALLLKYRTAPSGIQRKTDHTLVSDTDKESSALLKKRLSATFPEAALIDEESDNSSIKKSQYTFVIDPLDGTREYLAGQPNFSIMIGLMKDNVPVLGISYRPLLDEISYAYTGGGAYTEQAGRQARRTVVSSSQELQLMVSQSRTDTSFEELLKKLSPISIQKMGGSCKILEVAHGTATAFICPPRQTMHVWDLCAFSVILQEAGGTITDFSGKSLDFSLKNLAHDAGVIASNGLVHEKILSAIRTTT